MQQCHDDHPSDDLVEQETPRFRKMKPRVGVQYQQKVSKAPLAFDQYESTRPNASKLSMEYAHLTEQEVKEYQQGHHCNHKGELCRCLSSLIWKRDPTTTEASFCAPWNAWTRSVFFAIQNKSPISIPGILVLTISTDMDSKWDGGGYHLLKRLIGASWSSPPGVGCRLSFSSTTVWFKVGVTVL